MQIWYKNEKIVLDAFFLLFFVHYLVSIIQFFYNSQFPISLKHTHGYKMVSELRELSILARILLVSFVIAYKIISFSFLTLLSKTSKKWIMFLMADPWLPSRFKLVENTLEPWKFSELNWWAPLLTAIYKRSINLGGVCDGRKGAWLRNKRCNRMHSLILQISIKWSIKRYLKNWI